jgi:hypothetical protein
VEGGETNVEEIGRTAKIKHTQNKQRKNNTGKNQNQKAERTNKNKIQRETKQEHGNKMPNDQPERLGRDLAGSTTEEGGDGRKARWDMQMTYHRQRVAKTPRSERPKQGKKNRQQEKRKRGERGKKRREGDADQIQFGPNLLTSERSHQASDRS